MRTKDLIDDFINNVIVEIQSTDRIPLYVTARHGDQVIGHAFFFDAGVQGELRPGMAWIAEAYRGHGVAGIMHDAVRAKGIKIMPMNEITSLEELDLRKAAKAGAVAAGVLGGIYGLTGSPKIADVPAVTTTTQMVRPDAVAPNITKTDDQSATQSVKADVHPNYPESLKDLRSADATTRVNAFKQVLLPMIDRQNAKIARQRSTLLQLAKQKTLSDEQREWISQMMAYYGAKDISQLVQKVDIIPRSMALAQAAVESGWGQDELAQQANVFYGQKTYKPGGVTGAQGEKYAAFSDPEDSVRAYMRNLNSHPAYDDFREIRAKLRKSGKPIKGKQLITSLGRYSRLGKEYIDRVNSVISARGFDKLDIAQK